VRSTSVSLAKESTAVSGASSSAKPVVKDAVSPTISGIGVTKIGTNSATIEWKTDEDATSLVQYGVNGNYGLTAQKSGKTKNHSVELDSKKLEAGVTYSYRVKSADEYGNEATSSNRTFTTNSKNPPSPTPAASEAPATTVSAEVKQSNNSQYYIIGGALFIVFALILFFLKKGHTPHSDAGDNTGTAYYKSPEAKASNLAPAVHHEPPRPDTKTQPKHEGVKQETQFKAYNAEDKK
jgi:hypothetical protein